MWLHRKWLLGGLWGFMNVSWHNTFSLLMGIFQSTRKFITKSLFKVTKHILRFFFFFFNLLKKMVFEATTILFFCFWWSLRHRDDIYQKVITLSWVRCLMTSRDICAKLHWGSELDKDKFPNPRIYRLEESWSFDDMKQVGRSSSFPVHYKKRFQLKL